MMPIVCNILVMEVTFEVRTMVTQIGHTCTDGQHFDEIKLKNRHGMNIAGDQCQSYSSLNLTRCR